MIVEIIQFTDPVCTWCWGSEPVLRTLETRYGQQLKISYVMGGLVKNITAFYDSQNDIGGTPEGSNANIAKHWLEASASHGMPVEVEGFRLFSTEHLSTYPQNIAYKAAQLQDPIKADRFLRRIREASAAEAQQTNVTEVLTGLASETGLDISRFLDDFTNGKALKAFEDDLYITAQYRVHGFPGFLVKYGDKSIMLRGYQNYSNFTAVINSLTNGAVQQLEISNDESGVLEFITSYNRVAPAEISMALNLTAAVLEQHLASLMSKKKITRQKAGNGFFFVPASNPMLCDPETGVCQI